MRKFKQLIDKALKFFVFGLIASIWLYLAGYLILDWSGFWKMVGSMQGKSKGIALFLLFAGPFWLLSKLKPRPARQEQIIAHADVVYLRPFSADADAFLEFAQSAVGSDSGLESKSLEQCLVEALKPLGSIVGIGRPDEMLARDGAARVYVGEEGDWQTCVKRLVGHAKAVVIVAGESSGVLWEEDYARRSVEPDKLLVVLPAASRKKRAKAIVNIERAFGITLPPLDKQPRVPRFLGFDQQWKTITFANVYDYHVLKFLGERFLCATSCLKYKETLGLFLGRFVTIRAAEPETAKTKEH